jgi:hypothetical protein
MFDEYKQCSQASDDDMPLDMRQKRNPTRPVSDDDMPLDMRQKRNPTRPGSDDDMPLDMRHSKKRNPTKQCPRYACNRFAGVCHRDDINGKYASLGNCQAVCGHLPDALQNLIIGQYGVATSMAAVARKLSNPVDRLYEWVGMVMATIKNLQNIPGESVALQMGRDNDRYIFNNSEDVFVEYYDEWRVVYDYIFDPRIATRVAAGWKPIDILVDLILSRNYDVRGLEIRVNLHKKQFLCILPETAARVLGLKQRGCKVMTGGCAFKVGIWKLPFPAL